MHRFRKRVSSDDGVALILALFMVLIVSVLGASMISVGRTETLSSLNYKSMSQARYGAESGLHSAVNYLLYTYPATAPGTATDPLANYTTTVSPVTYNGNPVVLSSDPNVASNYPIAATVTAFTNNSSGSLVQGNTSVTYRARARLLSMRQFNDAYSGVPVTIQTWEITGVGGLAGAGAVTVEVSAIIERQTVPAYRYAAFATYNGCSAITFGGNAGTGSYDSGAALVAGVPVVASSGGNVGTNGNLAEGGNAVVNGTLSTPRSGVGNCTASNVTALTGDVSDVTGGLVELPQAVSMPTPAAISPLPPTTSDNLNSCPATVLYCASAGSNTTITPPTSASVVQMGNVSLSSNTILTLNPGIYEINSISMTGNSQIVVAGGGPVIIRVAGTGIAAGADAVKIAGNGFSNPTYDPSKFQIVYGGTGAVRVTGNGASAALIYAPNAVASITGNGTLYGSVVAGTVTDMGNARIAYDRRLERTALTQGNPAMTTFSWSSF